MKEANQKREISSEITPLIFRKLNHRALEATKEGAKLFSLREQPLAKIIENILYYESGCYMISGQRGCGKTTLTNQLLYILSNIEKEEIKNQIIEKLSIAPQIIPDEMFIFSTKIDVVKGYDEIDLLEKILRAICAQFLDICEGDLVKVIESRIDEEFLETLTGIVLDAKEFLDYKKVVSAGAGEGKTTSLGVALSLRFSQAFNALIESSELGAEVGTDFSYQISKMINRKISVEARDPSIEKIEDELSQILRCFTDSQFIEKLQKETIKRLSGKEIQEALTEALGGGKLKSLQEFLGKTGKNMSFFCGELKKKVIEQFSDAEAEETVLGAFDRVVVIIDDTDKAGYEEAIDVLNSLRALFQSKNCFFIFVGSERFYEDWYSYARPGERGIIDSIFSHVFYIPPFSVAETKSLLEKYLLDKPDSLDYYANILIMTCQGLPRQMIRTLDLITTKEGENQITKGNFFDFFNHEDYCILIRRFVECFTSYKDPRKEKCFYIASAILAYRKKMERDDLVEVLSEFLPSYSENIKEEIVEDLEEINKMMILSSELTESLSEFPRISEEREKEMIEFLISKKILSDALLKELELKYTPILGPREILEIDRKEIEIGKVKPGSFLEFPPDDRKRKRVSAVPR